MINLSSMFHLMIINNPILIFILNLYINSTVLIIFITKY